MADGESEYERTLLQLPSCYAFRVPALKSADGYRTADFPKDPIFTGKLRIVAKGKLALISLIDAENKVFASCPVTDDSAVERCLDSGRYFVIKIQNSQGKHAYVGIAFNERNDAFDFNVALAEHKAENQREEKATVVSDVVQPLRDLSLKEGEKIKVKIGTTTGSKEKKVLSSGASFLAPPPSDSKFKGLLAPPPADNHSSSHSDPFASNSGRTSTNKKDVNLLDL